MKYEGYNPHSAHLFDKMERSLARAFLVVKGKTERLFNLMKLIKLPDASGAKYNHQ